MKTLNQTEIDNTNGGIAPLLFAAFIGGMYLGMAIGNAMECTDSKDPK